MMDFFRRIFQFLFGTKDSPAPIEENPTQPRDQTPTPPPQPETHLPGEMENEPDLEGIFPDSAFNLRLIRFDFGTEDTLGKLYINGKFRCYTLENSRSGKGLLPPGTYPLSLKTTGGRHATYLYRFKDQHKGILSITGAAGFEAACIHIGNRVEDTTGSIISGTYIQRQTGSSFREVWFSDKAYMKIYPAISEYLVNGGNVSIIIS
ncbi:MAG: DUF5675 family protein [Bacteroidia bacterium]